MRHWVLKTEPDSYSFDDLLRERNAVWDGVKNPVAIRNIGEMKKGDALLIYHTGGEKAVVGTATVTGESRPDPKAKGGNLLVFELAAGKKLAKPVTLAAIRADSAFADLALVRQPRLSVVPVSESQYRRLLSLGGS